MTIGCGRILCAETLVASAGTNGCSCRGNTAVYLPADICASTRCADGTMPDAQCQCRDAGGYQPGRPPVPSRRTGAPGRVPGALRLRSCTLCTVEACRPEATTMARPVIVQSIKGMKSDASVGPHRIALDAPPEAGGGDEGPSPVEMLLGAIGA